MFIPSPVEAKTCIFLSPFFFCLKWSSCRKFTRTVSVILPFPQQRSRGEEVKPDVACEVSESFFSKELISTREDSPSACNALKFLVRICLPWKRIDLAAGRGGALVRIRKRKIIADAELEFQNVQEVYMQMQGHGCFFCVGWPQTLRLLWPSCHGFSILKDKKLPWCCKTGFPTRFYSMQWNHKCEMFTDGTHFKARVVRENLRRAVAPLKHSFNSWVFFSLEEKTLSKCPLGRV